MPEKDLKDLLRVQGVDVLGYGKIPKAVMQDRRLTVTAKAIYAYFCSFAGAGTSAFPSVEKACFDLAIRPETFIKHRKCLEQYGYITVEQVREKGKFDKNIYILEIIPKEPPITVLSDTVETEPIETVSTKPYTKNNSYKNNSYKINKQQQREDSKTEDPVVVDDDNYKKKMPDGIQKTAKTEKKLSTSSGQRFSKEQMQEYIENEERLGKLSEELGADFQMLLPLAKKHGFGKVIEKCEMAKNAKIDKNINGWLKKAVEENWEGKTKKKPSKKEGLQKWTEAGKFEDLYFN